MTATIYAWAGFALSVGTWVQYLSTIPRGKVPARPVGAALGHVVGLTLAALAMVMGRDGGGWISLIVWGMPIGFTLTLGGLFFFLLSQRKTPLGEIRVSVGEQILPFNAKTPGGESFASVSLEGQRYLLKFFRGFW